jgi:glycosyltransferase involved in cell wall biosynthesis
MTAVRPSNVKRTVSVVVPLYNTEKYIEECISSVLDQTLRDLEVLVVDDGSRDRSVEIVEEIARRDGRVRLLRHPGGVNLGVSCTRRLGIREAAGEYIAYLDADDAFEPTKLERQVSLMKAHPACLLCHTAIKTVTVPVGDEGISKRPESQVRPSIEAQAKRYSDYWNYFLSEIAEYSFLDRPDALKSNPICNSSALAIAATVRSAAVAIRQAFQAEDFLQWTLLATKGPFLFTPEPLTRYRVHVEASSYPVSQEPLKHLYRLTEFLLSLHALTDDPVLRARSEAELLYSLGLIRDIYAEGASDGTGDYLNASRQPSENFDVSSWKYSALELQSRVNNLESQVWHLSHRLATIRGSMVYRGLIKVRNLLNAIKPAATKRLNEGS